MVDIETISVRRLILHSVKHEFRMLMKESFAVFVNQAFYWRRLKSEFFSLPSPKFSEEAPRDTRAEDPDSQIN